MPELLLMESQPLKITPEYFMNPGISDPYCKKAGKISQ
jgi:hypothetical protein